MQREERIGADDDCTDPSLNEAGESRIDVTLGACGQDVDLQPDGMGGRLHVSRHGLGLWALRIEQDGDFGGCGHQLAQQLQSLSAVTALRRGLAEKRLCQEQ